MSLRQRIKRLLYGWRFTNWLIAMKGWRGYHWRTIYRHGRRGCSGWVKLASGEHRFYESMVRKPLSLPVAAWAALTFPHVHGEWELED